LKDKSTSQAEDVACLKAISQGDESAFELLYKRYQPMLLKFSAGLLNGDISQAADIVDDALFDVWNKSANYAEKAKVSTWIFTITRFKTIDYLRKQKNIILTDDVETILEDIESLPDSLSSHENEQERIKICLEKLSESHREMILLMYYQGLTIKEIAQITDTPANTVKTRMFHARDKMNSMLVKMGIKGYP
jgi:RNA polymerase sigma-70 factor (ECF subfamily)